MKKALRKNKFYVYTNTHVVKAYTHTFLGTPAVCVFPGHTFAFNFHILPFCKKDRKLNGNIASIEVLSEA